MRLETHSQVYIPSSHIFSQGGLYAGTSSMTVGMIIGLILLPLSWLLMAAVNKDHRESTGVNMPTRNAMRRIRRNARKKEVAESAEYDQWVKRKQAAHKKDNASRPKRTISGVVQDGSVSPTAHPTLSIKPQRIRAPEHEPFTFEHLEMIAKTFGWTLHRQAWGLYYLVDAHKNAIENPYAEASAIKTDFDRRDIEDFLLTC